MSMLSMGAVGMPTDAAILPADFESGSFEEMESFLAETLQNASSVLVDEYNTQEEEWILSKFQEIECLQAVLGEDFEILDERFFRIQILPPSLRDSSLKDQDNRTTPTSIWLSVCTLSSYPNCPPLVEIEDKSSLSRRDADALYVLLSREAEARLGGPMLVDLALIAQQFVLDAFDPTQKLTATTEAPAQVEAVGTYKAHVAAFAKVAPDEASVADAALGVLDPTCFAPAHPSEYVGSLASIFAKLPPHYTVLRVETILRTDLAFRFESVRRLMAAAYSPAPGTHTKAVAPSNITSKQSKNKQSKCTAAGAASSASAPGPKEAFVSWESQLVFHGTRPNNVGNIVSRGLLVPNGASVLHVHDSGYYGRGVYTTPDASVALSYASCDDHQVRRLLVCAVLMGRARQCTETMHGAPCTAGFNSHVSPGGHEWVVFKGAQLLPLYLLYVYYGKQTASSSTASVASAGGHAGGSHAGSVKKGRFGFDTQTRMELTRGAAGETAEQRQVRAASRAAKMLPMGYGPAGARMEVLDCCDWSDDEEEDAGEYDEERYADDWVRLLWEAQREASMS